MYEYRCALLRVVDADTLHLAVDLGCDVTISLTVRLAGLDAPELSTQEGKFARDYTAGWLATAPSLILTTTKDRREKYGRYLGVIARPDMPVTLNDSLLINGHAVPYDGGPR